ncbi:MAG: hypothetical protein EBR82_09770 [Caulobacteraceae bacterium]|nr:hypothetical protein [Caulobacteraceae bacterium]
MRGHQAIVALRKRGRRPDSVMVRVGYSSLPTWDSWHLDAGKVSPLVAAVEIDDRDRISSLERELDVVAGMIVMVHGDDPVRTRRIADLCVDAGATRCIVTVHNPASHETVGLWWRNEGEHAWQQF